MFNVFPPTKPEKVRAQLLYEARREELAHAAAAEHHKALADMYAARIVRLEAAVKAEAERAAS